MTGGKKQTILVTGGAGYVGSHSVLLLLKQNYPVVVVDNIPIASSKFSGGFDSNGNVTDDDNELPESLRRVEELACKKLNAFYRLDLVSDQESLENVFRRHNIRAVIHFAALKSVSESINLPLEYYTNNLVGTINLLNTMKRHGCRELIFSSSATVYGLPQYLPVDEEHQVGINVLNPYGRTKCMIEQMLKDLCTTTSVAVAKQKDNSGKGKNDATGNQSSSNSSSWNIISLRYFNPVGAHPSGYIGEYTQDVPNNLMPYISQVSIGRREQLFVFGNDFNTIDGTGVRDYIHIMDLANGHIHALDYLLKEEGNDQSKERAYRVFNLGTGKGYSVLEVIKTFEQVNGVKIPYKITARREGDAGEVYADAKLALKELDWSAKYSLVDMVRDTYKWQSTYPDGFKSQPTKFEQIQRIILTD